jgi:serine/threonine protein kinase
MKKPEPLKNYQQPLLSHNQMVIKPVDQVLCPEAVYLLSQIRHPALPALRGVEEIELDGQPPRDCFLFDFLPGTSLDRLSTAEQDDWPLLAKIQFFTELAQVVDFLHVQCEPGLLHLDIKPANVLLGPDLRPRLIDFGAMQHLARDPAGEQQAAALPACSGQNIACTPAFAAPEVLQGRPVMASDVYAIGLTMMSALTGISQAMKSRPDYRIFCVLCHHLCPVCSSAVCKPAR